MVCIIADPLCAVQYDREDAGALEGTPQKAQPARCRAGIDCPSEKCFVCLENDDVCPIRRRLCDSELAASQSVKQYVGLASH